MHLKLDIVLYCKPELKYKNQEMQGRINTLTTTFPNVSVGKESSCSAGDTGDVGSISSLRRSPGGGNGNLLQYSCLENPMDRGA